MAEIIMTFALGFLIASLIAIAFAAPLWRRAVQLTTKRLHASSPVSIEDFNADKDLMRAEFAMSARRLELSVEKLHNKAETRLAELDKREREVASLRDEMQQQVDLVALQQTEIEELQKHLDATEAALTRREQDYGDLQERLAEAHTVVTRQANAIREANSLVDGQKGKINTISSKLESKTEEAAEKTAEIAEKTTEIAVKAAAIAERDEQLGRCGKAVVEQKMRVAEQRRRLGEQEKLIASLTAEIEAARRSADDNDALAILAANKTEIAALRAKIARLNSEFRTKIAAERKEKTDLQQRLDDLAFDVDRASGAIDTMTDNTERDTPGPSWSPAANLRHIGDYDTPPAFRLAPTTIAPTTLADRIRALRQHIRKH